MLWLAGCGSSEDLDAWVAQPGQLVLNRRDTVITMSDQIPVWLKPEAGRVLISRRAQQGEHSARKRRKLATLAIEDGSLDPGSQHAKAELANHTLSHVRGPGEPARCQGPTIN